MTRNFIFDTRKKINVGKEFVLNESIPSEKWRQDRHLRSSNGADVESLVLLYL